MKKILLLFILIMICLINAAEFNIISDVKELQNDLTSQRYGYKDVNGEWCAILKVHTDISGLLFEGMGYEKYDSRGEGVYLVYMQPGSRNLKFKKDGFVPIMHNFPFKLESNKVYLLEIKSSGGSLDDIAVGIITDPQEATVFLDGKDLGQVKQIMTRVGKHEVKLKKFGYYTITDSIDVSAEKTLFEFRFDKTMDVELMISSDPTEAEVFIDGRNEGVTPVKVNYPEGDYSIEINKKYYEKTIGHLNVVSPKTIKRFTLKDVSSYIIVNTYDFAVVRLNGNIESEKDSFRVEPGEYLIDILTDRALPMKKKLTIGQNERISIDMFPELRKGSLLVKVEPSDAVFELFEDNEKKYNGKNAEVLNGITVGNYNLSVKKSGYKTFKKEIQINEGLIHNETGIVLEKGTDADGVMVFVEGGTFTMGSEEGDFDDKPEHNVTVSSFYIGETEVTNEQWINVTGLKSINTKWGETFYIEKDKNPITRLLIDDIVHFCNQLSEKEGLEKCYEFKKRIFGDNEWVCNFKSDGYRLPTEAEWEFAARGGNLSKGYYFSGSNDLDEVGWYEYNCEKTMDVGQKKPNELGLYDMSGNLYEICWDSYDEYRKDDVKDPVITGTSDYRVLRGGGTSAYSEWCRVFSRTKTNLKFRDSMFGFRVVRKAN